MIDFNKIKTIPIKDKNYKTKIKDFVRPKFIRGNNKKIKELANEILIARKNSKEVIFMIGAHIIKLGLSLYLIELIKKGIITHVAMNGAASIHDFEIAFAGKTSENVKENIKNGTFGMVEETGRFINEALKSGNKGYGYSIARKIEELDSKYKEYSIIYNCYKEKIPVTVHVAIGTDIIHQHPSCDGSAIGKKSYEDFKLFVATLSKLEKGVILNVGSAVIMPEVFLKALSIVRNLGYKVENFTRANFDMINHYRPYNNLLKRPTEKGKIFNIIERHEKTIPLLYKYILRENGS